MVYLILKKSMYVGKGYFWLKVVIMNQCVDEEDECEEIGQFTETHIAHTTT